MALTYTKIGEEHTSSPEQRAALDSAISRLDWFEIVPGKPLEGPMMPIMGLEAIISDIRIRRWVVAVAWDSIGRPLEGYALLACKTRKQAIYHIDCGDELVTVAWEELDVKG